MVLSGLTTADPLGGGVVTLTVKASPSGSESLVRTGMITGVIWLVAAESSWATGGRSIGVMSCPVLFELTGSCVGDETVAWSVTWGTAPAPTATVMGKLVDPPLARAAACVQVTFCPTAEQLQPFPPPDTYVNPAGRVSVT